MAEPLHQNSAKIIPFPAGLRRSSDRQRGWDSQDLSGPQKWQVIPALDYGCWYHEAALSDADVARKQ